MKFLSFGLFNRHSMIFRLSFSILGSVLVGIVILMFFISRNSTLILERFLMEGAKQAADSSISNISDTVTQFEHALYSVQSNLDKLDKEDVSEIKNILLSETEFLNIDRGKLASAWIYVFPPNDETFGQLYYSTYKGDKLKVKQKEFADIYTRYPWLRQAENQPSIYWSEPYFLDGGFGRQPVVSAVVPFSFDQDKKYSGLVVFSLNLLDIQKEVSEFRFFGWGRLLLLSQRGLYLVHPNPDIALKKTIFNLASEYDLPQLRHAGEQLLLGKRGIVEMPASSVFGDAVIFFYAPVPRIKWGVCLVFSQKHFFEPIHRFHVVLFAASLLWLAGIFVLISWICRRSAEPVLKLSKIAAQYGDGNFSGDLPKVNSHDELAILIRAFDKMKHNLSNHIEREKKTVAEQQKNESELEIAKHIQLTELPINFPLHPQFEMSAMMNAARRVGGDFYDFFFIDKTHFAVVIADVSGKGIPAALYMMTVKSLLKNIMNEVKKVKKAVYKLNNELCRRNSTQMFVTLFAAVLDLKTGILEYVNAGHNPPLLMTNTSKFKYMAKSKNVVLGIMEDYRFSANKVRLQQGDRLFLYTDGITEAQSRQGVFFGEDRLKSLLNSNLKPCADTLDYIRENVVSFVNGAEQSDDMTMMELIYFGEKQSYVTEALSEKHDEALQYVSTALQAHKLSMDKINKALLATGEIFANIVGYAYENKGNLRIAIYQEDDVVYMRFTDAGRAYNPLEKEEPDVDLGADLRPIGGLGIYIVKQVADYMNYERREGLNIFTIGIKKG